MGFDDVESFTIFGLQVRCTPEQQREIVRRVRLTGEWHRWHALDSVIRTQHCCSDVEATFRAQLAEARTTAAELAKAEGALTRITLDVIAQVAV